MRWPTPASIVLGVESRVAAHPERWGDAVIVRKDVAASYHLAVVVDDALQGVTRVVRGADLEAATDLHVLLQRLLGMLPPCYHHHRIIRDVGGAKLSKRWRAKSLADFRARGATPCAVRRALRIRSGRKRLSPSQNLSASRAARAGSNCWPFAAAHPFVRADA